MKRINKDELYQHLNDFLRLKGVELKEGSYVQRIQKGCALLSDAVNLGQQGFVRAKAGIEKKIEQMRQVVHEKTAPKPPPNAPTPGKSRARARSENQPKRGPTKRPNAKSKQPARRRR
jgi:hypothetical protein